MAEATKGDPVTVHDVPTVQRRRFLARTFLLVCSARGTWLPRAGDHDEIHLGLAELLALSAIGGADDPNSLDDRLDHVASRAAVDRERLDAFVEQLETRGLLSTEEAAGPPTDGREARPEVAHDIEAARSTLPPLRDDTSLTLSGAVVFGMRGDAFEHLDHDAREVVTLDAIELAFLGCLRDVTQAREAISRHREEAGPVALSDESVAQLLERLVAAGVVVPLDEVTRLQGAGLRTEQQNREAMVRIKRFIEANEECVRAHGSRGVDGGGAAATDRVRVVPINPDRSFPQLALGMLLAYAREYEGGRLHDRYDLDPDWHLSRERRKSFRDRPGIFLFSNYVWSHHKNLSTSASLKELSPSSLMIHGGPDTPKYEVDTKTYLRRNPHVDVAVRGEGEQTIAEILDALDGEIDVGPPDLSALRQVPGITFREGNTIVRTPDRERIADLSTIPSPFLSGVFDVYGEVGGGSAIIETNRGCPYSCTFCDWGSATLSRIRKFPLDRVFAEIEWCAQHEVELIFLADANFGIMERDVEIAEKVAELKETYGYPKVFTTNYAKNTVKHLRRIVQAMVGAGVITEGLLSLQSMDATTLKTVNRTNIKVDKYDELASEFRRARLPLFVDLMLGLPGSSTAGFRYDLQQCVDREVTAKIFQTEVLVNSPMNEPSYREKHRIEVASGDGGWYSTSRLSSEDTGRNLVVSTATFTREEYEEMLDLRRVYLLCENYGVLRHVSRWVHQEHGMTEVELYERLRREVAADRERWPMISLTLEIVPEIMVAPRSWRLFIDEVGEYLRSELGITDPALDTVLTVQHGLLPTRGRRFPEILELTHDYAGWYRAMLEAKDAGHRDDWPDHVPHLREFPPATFEIEDRNQICTIGIGGRLEENTYGDWELTSPVARAVSARHLQFV